MMNISGYVESDAVYLETKFVALMQDLSHPPRERLFVILIQIVRVTFLLNCQKFLRHFSPKLQGLILDVI